MSDQVRLRVIHSDLRAFKLKLEGVQQSTVAYRKAREAEELAGLPDRRKIIEGLQWIEGDLANALDTLKRLI